jgi:TRAP-type C4-dicarboxylate transport system substrate-binding protein
MSKLPGIFLTAILLTALIFTGCSAQAPPPKPSPATTTPAPAPTVKPIELKFGHYNPPTGRTTVKYLNVWAKNVEEATKGQVKVTMYPSASLFQAKDTLESIIGGVADIGWTSLGYQPGAYPLTSVMNLPFLNLPSGKVDARSLGQGAINSHILQELYETMPEIKAEYSKVKLLFLHTSDAFFLATKKKTVANIADLKGMKIRENSGPQLEMWKLLGASPVMMTMPDVYEAMDKGITDGTTLAWAAIPTYKLDEVTKYWTDAPLYLAEFEIIMNLDSWNKLSPDIQKAIMSVSGIKGAEFAGESAFGEDVKTEVLTQSKNKLERVALDAGEYEKMKSIAGKPLWDKWVSDMAAKGLPGQKVLDEVLRLLDKYK